MKRIALAALLLIALAGCGGSDDREPEPQDTLLPVDCASGSQVCR